ncbi:invasion associated locus B family protein [Aliiruegeria lutimaris]|uniref:Invasion protein IalB, involved in pathogenesis n=1 Tax=Aliiruegeria lutimaris TaxID=571298 RepID=A0A1G8KYK2_9RHOB|nr:invasion associated locus B family protein [Aliiruegeria lutimaris]SDI47960.1 Invasion protein IalB, involved in pathogenesis [Aliiruegeria lutimaris]
MTFLSSSRLTSVALAAALAALPAIAQDTASEEPAAEAEASQPADAAGAPAATETEQSTDQSLGQPYVAEVAGDWQIECLRTTLEADPCRMVQILLDQGNPAVRVEVMTLPAASPAPAVATFYAPLETLLSEQLTLSIDGGRKSQHQFNYCTPQFCVAQVPFAPDAVTAFKRGAKAEASIIPLRAPDQRVNLTMSLTGFTAGYDKLAELNKASEEAIRKAQSAGGN